MSKKLRHHYVPSGLTRNFCIEEKRVYYYDVKEKTIKPSSPGDAFRIKKLHSIVKEGGEVDHNSVEDWLMQFEGNGCATIKKLLAGNEISQDEREWLCSMWGVQLLRTPVIRAGIETFLKETVRTTAKVLDHSGHFGEMPDSLKQFGNNMSELIDNGTVDISICLPQVTMQFFVALPRVAQFLSVMNWCLLESSDDNYFIISDNPCAIVDPDFDLHGMGIGLGHPNVEVTLPIGKNHCLLASWNEIPASLKASKRHVSAINRRTALFGERFYAYPLESKKILNFLKPYADAVPEMQAESIPMPEGDRAGYMIISRQNLFTNPQYKRIYKNLPLIFPEVVRKFKVA
ncbi:MAG: DUF4238 domain-containing protein [Alphaproteobacteria bacterium]|nr:DUF4238 domain-containing protein [Alphaproteobacteria bacterium]